MWPVIMITIALLILGLLIAFIVMRKRMKHAPPTDYYSFFVIGIIWMIFGIFSMFRYHEDNFNFFLLLGVVFAAIGISHKKDWKKNRRTWDKLSKEEKQFKFWTIVILGILVLAGLIIFFVGAR
ncbi:hypothetical protein KY363_08365 [Candidatus Woesearchaeota archaeon]|nr:hypothetical protein [Candidatus Woesearchaeota archaeon]